MKDSTTAVCALAFSLAFGLSTARADLGSGEERTLQRLVLAEAGGEGELGMALVARSVLNRAALVQSGRIAPGTYLANGDQLRDVVYGRNQYQPISDGSFYRQRSAQEQSAARRAIALARDTEALRARLRQAGKSEDAIDRLLNATGFRTRTAYYDASQDYDTEVYGNHVFNSDRFARQEDVQGLFETAFAADLDTFDEQHPYALAALPADQARTEQRLASYTPSAGARPPAGYAGGAAPGRAGMVQVLQQVNPGAVQTASQEPKVNIFLDALLRALLEHAETTRVAQGRTSTRAS